MAVCGSHRRVLTRCIALTACLGLVPAWAQDTTGTAGQIAGGSPQQQAYCRQLERQLAPDWQQGTVARDLVPRIEAQMARADQQNRRSQAMAEQADCFDYFLFTKSWRDTSQCRQFHQQIDEAQRALADLDRQRNGANSSQDRASRQDALVTELARNRCGPQYETALQRRTGSGASATGFWNDNESLAPGGAMPGFDGAVPGSTFRTICVRACDGYYFPISFATTQDRFQHDAQVCQSQGGESTSLYYYPNPGGEVQQAVGLDGAPYSALKNAFRYRKELVSSCAFKGAADGMEPVADTQPMQSPDPGAQRASMAPGTAAVAGSDDTAETLPAGEFGTMTVEPAPADSQSN